MENPWISINDKFPDQDGVYDVKHIRDGNPLEFGHSYFFENEFQESDHMKELFGEISHWRVKEE